MLGSHRSLLARHTGPFQEPHHHDDDDYNYNNNNNNNNNNERISRAPFHVKHAQLR